jgi:DNA (cytosine-5)-methyltransferase 1
MFHWEAFRHLTIPEVKRIQSFPDDYVLTQGYMKRWERIGRSVPPVMMMNIAKTVQTEILDKCAA